MSCLDCFKTQLLDIKTNYVWHDADIEIRACKKHLKEVLKVLNKANKKYLKTEQLNNDDGLSK